MVFFIHKRRAISLNERIKKIRKSLDLTQAEFGRRIGMKQNTIALIEGGRNTSNQTIFAICREFRVNEAWLRTGKGEMFLPDASNALEALARERGLSYGAYIAIEKFLKLKPEIQEGIIGYFTEVAAALNADEIPSSSPALPGNATPEKLHAELDRQIDEEKEATEKSEVS